MSEVERVFCQKCTMEIVTGINADAPKPPVQTTIREEFPITCSDCGKPATVPFKPNPGSTHLKCKECFAK